MIPENIKLERQKLNNEINSLKKIIAGDKFEWLESLEEIAVLNYNNNNGLYIDSQHTPKESIKEFIEEIEINNQNIMNAREIENLYRKISISFGHYSNSPWIPKIRVWQYIQQLLREKINEKN